MTPQQKPELLPCPYCQAAMNVRTHTAFHPPNDCWLSDHELDEVDYQRWNNRPVAPAASRDQALDDAAEAVKVAYKDYCTLPEAESRAKYSTAVLQDMLVAAIKAGQSVPAAVSRDQIIDEVIAEARRVGIHEPLSLHDDPYIRGSIDAQNIIINALLALKTPKERG
jgi:hypothetical protein